jgi:hypothetical protein
LPLSQKRFGSKITALILHRVLIRKNMRKRKKNTNQTDLFELMAHLEQLEQISSELKMVESLGQQELSTIVEKQIDWVELEEN